MIKLRFKENLRARARLKSGAGFCQGVARVATASRSPERRRLPIIPTEEVPMLCSALAAAALALLAAARPAAASTALGLGADWLVDPERGALQLTLAADTRLARHVTVGARFGALGLGDPTRFGAVIDGRLRIRGTRVYAEGLVGPWILFDDDDHVRLHAAFGFGLLTRSLSFGLEVGWLDPTSMIGVRVAFPL